MRTYGRANRPCLGRGDPALPQSAKNTDCLDETAGLVLQSLRRCCALLDQGGVLLRDLVQMQDRLADLGDPGALLHGGGCDLGNEVLDMRHLGHDVFHRLACIVYQPCARLHTFDACLDQRLDLLGGFGAALRKVANLARHDCKATPGLTGTRRLDRSTN